jgi:hypothetical protein
MATASSTDWMEYVAPDFLWPAKQVDAFRHTTTGEILHSDTCLLPDTLRARGVQLESFGLI